MLPCIIFEDEHLLVVNKPAGLNTHSPSPFAGEGLFDWLRHREPRWAKIAIMQRLDKQTSGVIVFALTPVANRSLAAQFEAHKIRKSYLLLTDRLQVKIPARCKSTIIKTGDKFASRPWVEGAELAETEFECVPPERVARMLGDACVPPQGTRLVEARPLTGRTHQIRLHAASSGFPVLGDSFYGGTSSGRVYLHAWEIRFSHPVTGAEMRFSAPPEFLRTAGAIAEKTRPSQLRDAIIDQSETTAFRALHGAEDEFPGCYVDVMGDFMLVQTVSPIEPVFRTTLEKLATQHRSAAVYHKPLMRHTRGRGAEASPAPLFGAEAPERFTVRENGLLFELSFREGYSVGLFLDQRDNRRRLLSGHVAAGFPLYDFKAGSRQPEVLNTFAYTCAFSAAAAKQGARTTSLDLSKKYLEWGRRNFDLNSLPILGHDFVYGDVFDWLKRFARKGRAFDLVLLDPPTFSQSKEHGVFRAEKDYGALVGAALPLLRKNGVLFASTNAADWPPEEFLSTLDTAVKKAGRTVRSRHYAPQPPDFPISREEPAYLKTAWLRVS